VKKVPQKWPYIYGHSRNPVKEVRQEYYYFPPSVAITGILLRKLSNGQPFDGEPCETDKIFCFYCIGAC
jgi:hypothetical protein